MKSAVINILLLCLIVACQEKKFKTRATGVVVEAATGKPVANAWVALKGGVGNSGPINVGSTSDGEYVETYANANGEFDLEIESVHQGYLTVGQKDYFPYREGGIGWKILDKGLNANLTMSIESIGKLFCKFKNKGGGNEKDSLIIILLSYRDKMPFENNQWGGGKLRIGNNVHSLFTYEPYDLEGNRYHPYIIRYRPHDGQWIEYMDSVFVKAFQVNTDTIYYPR